MGRQGFAPAGVLTGGEACRCGALNGAESSPVTVTVPPLASTPRLLRYSPHRRINGKTTGLARVWPCLAPRRINGKTSR
ncbi:hypothetical protein [Paenibacillus sanfengchensis]|uniref:hypothetical protein n=1 Tax=Paenibacillus sanfengchensis TaxID=3119819 RepID=UPI002FE3186F